VSARVIDASVLAYALTGREPEAVTARKMLQDNECHAPHLIDAELGNVLRRRSRAGDITSAQALTALAAAQDLVDFRHPHSGAVAEIAWSLRENLTFYDGLYVALAMRLHLPLITGDHRLARAPALPCRIELI
jgi:predicted nucleic acid-binding protein